MKLKEGFASHSDEILITKNELEEIKRIKKELQNQLHQELTATHTNFTSSNERDEVIKQLEEKRNTQAQNNAKQYQVINQ